MNLWKWITNDYYRIEMANYNNFLPGDVGTYVVVKKRVIWEYGLTQDQAQELANYLNEKEE